MKSAFKKPEDRAQTSFLFGDLLVNVAGRSVRRNKEVLRIPDLSFDVLVALIRNAPEPVSTEQLARDVWKSEHVATETIAQRIKLLRRSLGDNPKSATYIRTVRNVGYACVAPVQPVSPKHAAHQSRRRRTFVLAGVVVLTGAITFAALFEPATTPANEDEPAVASPPPLARSIVERAQALLDIQQSDETSEAIDMLRQARELDPTGVDVIVTLSFALSTRATKFQGSDSDATEAEKLARSALGIRPESSNAWHALAYALDAQGRVDEALGSYTRAFEINPSDTSGMSSAAYLLAIRGRLFESLTLEARAMRGQDSSRYADVQIAFVLDLMDHPAASTWLGRAETLSHNQVVYLAEVASAHLRDGLPREALGVLARASGSEFDAPRLSALRGRASLALGDRDTAREHFNAAEGRAQLDLAALDALEGNNRSAMQHVRATTSSMMNGNSWPGARVGLAEIYAAMNDNDAALDNLSRAVDLGWRDIGTIVHSPFLQEVIRTDEWRQIRMRIERELAIQRGLVDGSSELSGIIGL